MESSSPMALPSGSHAPAVARRHLERIGRAWPSDLLHSALLLVSETVTNAVRHGGGTITLVVRWSRTLVRVEVHDEADTTPVVRPAPTGDAEGGRGLHLIEVLSTRWGVQPDPPGKTVWFELAVA